MKPYRLMFILMGCILISALAGYLFGYDMAEKDLKEPMKLGTTRCTTYLRREGPLRGEIYSHCEGVE